ncbi:MAG: type II toxin-antitoxin system VapC family toxin [Acidimicrobiia bacterium]
MKAFLDTNVFLYAVGVHSQYRDPCRRILAGAGRGEFQAVVNIEVLQEYVHVRSRKGIGRDDAALESTDIVSSCRVEDVDMATFQVALRTFVATPAVGLRDALHAATAASQLVDGVVSADRGFDAVPGLTRYDPVDFAEELDSRTSHSA